MRTLPRHDPEPPTSVKQHPLFVTAFANVRLFDEQNVLIQLRDIRRRRFRVM